MTPLLVLVIPIYNEQEVLEELHRRLRAALETIPALDWRVLYVDDGSERSTRELLRRQHEEDGRFGVLRLSRNFGHEAAITAGLDHAEADVVVVLDGDLQDPPEMIPRLIAAWREGGQVVFAVRRGRADRGWRGLGFRLFHSLFRLLSDFPVAARTGAFILLDRVALDAVRALPERNRYLPGLHTWVGFDQRFLTYDREARAAGDPKQSFRRLLALAFDAVFSFSYKPLRLMTWSGIGISLAGFLFGLHFVVKRLLGIETAQTGFTTLVTLVLFLGGIQLLGFGLIGEYLGRVYDEVKRRPLYLVRERLGVDAPEVGGTGGRRG
jgi:dolichol-phosphate mannosyltransferase